MTRLIDLWQPIFEGMKVYPGHLKTVTFQHVTHEEIAPRPEPLLRPGGLSRRLRHPTPDRYHSRPPP